jgi:hypothetical protein
MRARGTVEARERLRIVLAPTVRGKGVAGRVPMVNREH